MAGFLNTSEAAKSLGISRSRMQVLISTGRIPSQKVGNQYIVDEKDLAKVKDRKPGRPRKAPPAKPARRAKGK